MARRSHPEDDPAFLTPESAVPPSLPEAAARAAHLRLEGVHALSNQLSPEEYLRGALTRLGVPPEEIARMDPETVRELVRILSVGR